LTPDDRAFGRLEGKVDETIDRVSRIEQSIASMGATSSAEHATVGRKLDELGKEFREGLERRDARIDSLESTRDKGSGVAKAIEVGKGLAVLALMLLTYLAAQGNVG
jgi:hypothetical protein